jgi:chromosome segregation ATPase
VEATGKYSRAIAELSRQRLEASKSYQSQLQHAREEDAQVTELRKLIRRDHAVADDVDRRVNKDRAAVRESIAARSEAAAHFKEARLGVREAAITAKSAEQQLRDTEASGKVATETLDHDLEQRRALLRRLEDEQRQLHHAAAEEMRAMHSAVATSANFRGASGHLAQTAEGAKHEVEELTRAILELNRRINSLAARPGSLLPEGGANKRRSQRRSAL